MRRTKSSCCSSAGYQFLWHAADRHPDIGGWPLLDLDISGPADRICMIGGYLCHPANVHVGMGGAWDPISRMRTSSQKHYPLIRHIRSVGIP